MVIVAGRSSRFLSLSLDAVGRAITEMHDLVFALVCFAPSALNDLQVGLVLLPEHLCGSRGSGLSGMILTSVHTGGE